MFSKVPKSSSEERRSKGNLLGMHVSENGKKGRYALSKVVYNCPKMQSTPHSNREYQFMHSNNIHHRVQVIILTYSSNGSTTNRWQAQIDHRARTKQQVGETTDHTMIWTADMRSTLAKTKAVVVKVVYRCLLILIERIPTQKPIQKAQPKWGKYQVDKIFTVHFINCVL